MESDRDLAPSRVNGAGSRTGTDKGANSLESHEARIGTSVGVVDGNKRTGMGRVGTIERTYGHPNYLAVDVRFEDGSVELYWYHELRTMEGQPLP